MSGGEGYTLARFLVLLPIERQCLACILPADGSQESYVKTKTGVLLVTFGLPCLRATSLGTLLALAIA